MISRRLKAMMPRSLFGRATLIVLVPVAAILLAGGIVFFERLYAGVTAQMSRGAAAEARLVIAHYEAGSGGAGALASARRVADPLGIGLTREGSIADRRGRFDLSGRTVTDVLMTEVPNAAAVDLVSEDGRVLVEVETAAGPLVLSFERARLSPRNPHQFLVVIGLTALLMTAVALLYLRGQVRPIRRLAVAADAFGKGRRLPYRPAGASEIRQAGGAFLEMRDRIERQIEQRTLMLTGVSHDLRTPITRMKLAVGMMDGPEAEALAGDIEDMERMVNAFLDFARGDDPEEPEAADPAAIVRDAVDRARRGGAAVETGVLDEAAEVVLRPHAIGRALDNLIGNAVRHGTRAEVSFTAEGFENVFAVDDDGPGIAEADRARALRPFVRLDAARNQDAGSRVGLGLSIAADIARRHGGRLDLTESPSLGGLSARIVLPR